VGSPRQCAEGSPVKRYLQPELIILGIANIIFFNIINWNDY
jgi:hypothetical protein